MASSTFVIPHILMNVTRSAPSTLTSMSCSRISASPISTASTPIAPSLTISSRVNIPLSLTSVLSLLLAPEPSAAAAPLSPG